MEQETIRIRDSNRSHFPNRVSTNLHPIPRYRQPQV